MATEPMEANLAAVPHRLGPGAFAATAASALFVASGYFINVALGRLFGPADYGLFGVAIGLMTLVNALQISAVPQAIATMAAERIYSTADLIRTGAFIQISTGFLLAAVLFGLAQPLANVFGDVRLIVLFQVAALTLPLYAGFTLLLSFAGGQGQYVRQGVLLSTYSVTKAAFAVGLGALFSLPGAVAGYLAAPVVGIIAARRLVIRGGRVLPLRPILAASLPLLLTATFTVGHLNVDLFIVKALLPQASDAGYYTAAQNISRVPYYLMTGLAILLVPAVARAVSSGHEASTMVGQALRFGLLVVAPTSALLVGTADDIVVLLYGETYLPAAPVLRLLCVAMGFFALCALIASILAGAGNPYRAAAAAGAGTAVTAAAGSLLVVEHGIGGAGTATLLGTAVALSFGWLFAATRLGATVPGLTVVRAVGAAVVVGIAAHVLDGPAVVVGIPLLLLAYGVLLLASGELRKDEVTKLMRIR